MSRLRHLFALAALAALATVLVACGDDGSDNSDANPKAVAAKATLEGIESGEIDLSLELQASGKEGGDLSVSVSGPFQAAEEGGKPQFDLDAEVSGKMQGEPVDFDGGLVLLPNSAYVNFEGTEYEVDPTTFSFVESAINQAQQQGGGQGNGSAACQEVAEGTDLSSFIDNLKNEGSADVGGTQTTKLSGDLDVSGAIDTFKALSDDPACSAQLEAAGEVPSPAELSEAEKELNRTLKTAKVELYVGDDDIVRRVVADLTLEPKEADGPSNVDIALDLTLTGVNESQEIPVPEGAKPLNDLFLKLGVNPLELAGALQGGEGLGSLLEELGGAAGGDQQGASGQGGGKSKSGDGGRQAYLDCISGASNAADLQKCNKLLR